MQKTTYQKYWKTINKNSKEKTNKKLGIGIRSFALVVGIISTAIVSIILGGNLLELFKIALLTILINITLWAIVWVVYFIYYRTHEFVIIYNDKEDKINKLESILSTKKANIDVKEYCYPSYLQATKVGIFIQNNDEYDISPRVKILGDIQQTEYSDDGDKKVSFIRMDNNNRIIGADTNAKIEINDAGELIIFEVERNENVFLLLKKHVLLKSFYSIKSGEYKINHVRWDITFEIFGKFNNEQFKNGVYSTFIEASMRNDEVLVQINEIEMLQNQTEY